MKTVIVYTYAGNIAEKYELYTHRFLHSYAHNPPGFEHDTVIVINKGLATTETACMFSSLPNVTFLHHDNSGYDIGAFQLAARKVTCDMMVFFGASTFFTRPGWLMRMHSAFEKHGNGQYGAMGNRGNLDVRVWPHIRTTAFWMHPELMNAYPVRVTRPEQRHPFEHGKNCFTEWVKSQGLKNWVITWSSDLLWKDWDSDPNGFHRGNQGSLLAGDHISERPYYNSDRCKHPTQLERQLRLSPHCDPWRGEQCWTCLMPT